MNPGRPIVLLDAALVIGIVWALSSLVSANAVINRARSEERSCLSNVRQISRAMLQYAQDNDERLPAVIRDDRGNGGCADRMPEFLPLLNYPANPGWVTHFVPGSQWNKVLLKYLKSPRALTCPSDPTTPYKLAPSLSYSAATGPESLWLPMGCEVRNGVMGTNWSDVLSAIPRPSGTALLYEHIIDPAIDPWQHNVGTIEDEDWTGRKDVAWCFGKTGAAYLRDDYTFSYNTMGFVGPHRRGGHIATCDGHAMWIPRGGGRRGGSFDCKLPATASVFDKRYPL